MFAFLIPFLLGPILVAAIALGFGSAVYRGLDLAGEWRERYFILVLLFPVLHVLLHWTRGPDRVPVPRNLREMTNENEISDLRAGRIQAYPRWATLRTGIATALKTFASHLLGGSLGREAIVVHLTGLAAPFIQSVPSFGRVPFRRWKSALLAVGFAVAVGNPWCAFTFLIEKDPRQAKSIPTLWTVGFALVALDFAKRLLGVHLPELALPFADRATALAAALTPSVDSSAWRTFGALLLLTLAGAIAVHVLLRIQRAGIFRRGLAFTLPIAIAYAAAVYFFEAKRWVGLGLPVIAESFAGGAAATGAAITWFDPAIKLALTSLSIALGFFGGEFVPLLFIGSTLGNVIGSAFGLAGALLPGIGLYLVYGIAARLPITTLVLIGGKFGWGIFPYSAACVIVSLMFRPAEGIFYVKKDLGAPV